MQEWSLCEKLAPSRNRSLPARTGLALSGQIGLEAVKKASSLDPFPSARACPAPIAWAHPGVAGSLGDRCGASPRFGTGKLAPTKGLPLTHKS